MSCIAAINLGNKYHNHIIDKSLILIGASLSEPHTSCVVAVSVVGIYMYIGHVRHSVIT